MTREHIPSAQAATWSGIAGNMGLAVIKAGVGYMANSKSLLADGLYSASEAGSALAGLFPSSLYVIRIRLAGIGLKNTHGLPDRESPYCYLC